MAGAVAGTGVESAMILDPVSTGSGGMGISNDVSVASSGAVSAVDASRFIRGSNCEESPVPLPGLPATTGSPIANSKSSLPTRIRSPELRSISPRTRWSLTNVPLVLPRSRM